MRLTITLPRSLDRCLAKAWAFALVWRRFVRDGRRRNAKLRNLTRMQLARCDEAWELRECGMDVETLPFPIRRRFESDLSAMAASRCIRERLILDRDQTPL